MSPTPASAWVQKEARHMPSSSCTNTTRINPPASSCSPTTGQAPAPPGPTPPAHPRRMPRRRGPRIPRPDLRNNPIFAPARPAVPCPPRPRPGSAAPPGDRPNHLSSFLLHPAVPPPPRLAIVLPPRPCAASLRLAGRPHPRENPRLGAGSRYDGPVSPPRAALPSAPTPFSSFCLLGVSVSLWLIL